MVYSIMYLTEFDFRYQNKRATKCFDYQNVNSNNKKKDSDANKMSLSEKTSTPNWTHNITKSETGNRAIRGSGRNNGR